jgi:hypothetical protein
VRYFGADLLENGDFYLEFSFPEFSRKSPNFFSNIPSKKSAATVSF